ncbi:hypothetical protein CO110_07345, partial [Candidatus Desantisbacteria bacterium CG_4_9_14_3_um_filter_40_11]
MPVICNRTGRNACPADNSVDNRKTGGKPGENRGQRPFFLTREDLYGNIYLLWQEWQELSYQ